MLTDCPRSPRENHGHPPPHHNIHYLTQNQQQDPVIPASLPSVQCLPCKVNTRNGLQLFIGASMSLVYNRDNVD